MKTAICFSGYLRTYKLTFPTIKTNLLDKLKPDVFIHTWDRVDFNSFPIFSQELNKIFYPKLLLIERMNRSRGSEYRKYLVDNRSAENVSNMFYSIYRADELRQQYENKNKFKYDLVIRCRFDLKFLENLPEIDLLSLNLPKDGKFSGENDQFAIGNSDIMTKYSSLYLNLNNIVNQIDFRPESLLKQHLKNNNIAIKHCPIRYVIQRSRDRFFDNAIHSPG